MVSPILGCEYRLGDWTNIINSPSSISTSRFFRAKAERSEPFEFIKVWYDRKRLHSSLGDMSSIEFEAAQLNNQQRWTA